ncbi:FAD-dependent monooxygenase [Novosphingobium album (ex Hu et al. 2023)]|uniref:FAD-dependent monooxygenase n=1 Tax=Novosphingobium album (ex Hu et al. 2023) TaxID=2930093 RepID=A0ABT0B767_9SPHN|nr:FAD-dependent monooxygenase [Novosphingobium album (ex Hu et al. 2023)]MCJ2180874.1 FAD-dependent monooxygenase [Novosphingobium album (ex Hu et al. 2023)]
MRPVRDILICGASIAGPALAWWLHQHGFRPVLLEKAPAPRPGGHAIDIRGAALGVIRAMGLEASIRANRTQMKGTSRLDRDGNEVWRSEEMTISGGSFARDAIEIMREDLSRILLGALPKDVETIYGDSVEMLREDADGIDATFVSGTQRRFDLVVGADGLASSMRRQVFGPDSEYLLPFDMVLAPFSSPNMIGLEDWQITYDDGNGSCMIYTAPGNETLRVCFGFTAPLKDLLEDRASQIALVRENCAGMAWHVPGLLDNMEAAPDFYLGPIAQVKMKGWTRGRVALVGDAAYCPSPFTGQGTSLALVGAYALAREVAHYPTAPADAFARYEAIMRPFVEVNQAIAGLSRDPRFGSDPGYYTDVIEPAMAHAENAVKLPELTGAYT